MSAPTVTRTTARRGLAVPVATVAAVLALIAGYLLLVPFWFNTGGAVAADALPPGTPALFTGGILLVIVNAWLQALVVARRGATVTSVGLLVFQLLMTAGNLAIIIEMVVDSTPWTRWDNTWMVAAAGAGVVLWLWLRHSPVRGEAVKVSAALAGRVVIQAAIAGWELVNRVTMPGQLLVFIAAFGACRLVPVWVQWRRTRLVPERAVPALALVLTETANAATLALLGAAWMVAR